MRRREIVNTAKDKMLTDLNNNDAASLPDAMQEAGINSTGFGQGHTAGTLVDNPAEVLTWLVL